MEKVWQGLCVGNMENATRLVCEHSSAGEFLSNTTQVTERMEAALWSNLEKIKEPF